MIRPGLRREPSAAIIKHQGIKHQGRGLSMVGGRPLIASRPFDKLGMRGGRYQSGDTIRVSGGFAWGEPLSNISESGSSVIV